MADFFTLDRAGSLAVGQVLDVDLDLSGRRAYPVEDVYTRADLEDFARGLYNGGLSEHGKRYLLEEFIVTYDASGKPTLYVPNTPVVELVTELVRRQSFPELPSRFACWFGWRTAQEARRFGTRYPIPGAGAPRVFRVRCERSSRHDMGLLMLGGSTLGAWLFASRYWSGGSGPNPVWEDLLVPPVEVLERVE